MRKGSHFTAMHMGPHTPPLPPGGKQLQARQHAVWHEGRGMEKRSPGTKSPPREADNGLSCHTAQSPGLGTRASLPGRDPAWAAISGPSLHTLPHAAFSLPEEPATLFPLSMPLFLSLEVRGNKISLRELLRSLRGNMQYTTDSQAGCSKWPPGFLLACSQG